MEKATQRQPPFDISVSNPHRSYSRSRISVKYEISSTDFTKLQEQFRFMLADAEVFQHRPTPNHPTRVLSLRDELFANSAAYGRISHIPIRNRIESDAEADKLLEEIKIINVQDLGKIRAVGLRLQMRSPKGTQDGEGRLHPFLGTL